MKYGLLLFLILSTNTLALTDYQKEVKSIARKIGNNNCIPNMCFGKTLQAIVWQESSFGLFVLGDAEKSIEKASLGAFQIKLSTAKYVIEKQNLNQYNYLLTEDQLLINKLITDVEFSAKIAVNYLIVNYNRAIRNNRLNPWFYSVSKYNGGSNNTKYVNKIKEKLAKL